MKSASTEEINDSFYFIVDMFYFMTVPYHKYYVLVCSKNFKIWMYAYSGISPGGITILITSDINLYFMIRSLDVVADREGEAFT